MLGLVAGSVMTASKAAVLVVIRLQGEASHGRYCHLDARLHILYGETLVKCNKGYSTARG